MTQINQEKELTIIINVFVFDIFLSSKFISIILMQNVPRFIKSYYSKITSHSVPFINPTVITLLHYY